jgi:hypothetical protein
VQIASGTARTKNDPGAKAQLGGDAGPTGFRPGCGVARCRPAGPSNRKRSFWRTGRSNTIFWRTRTRSVPLLRRATPVRRCHATRAMSRIGAVSSPLAARDPERERRSGRKSTLRPTIRTRLVHPSRTSRCVRLGRHIRSLPARRGIRSLPARRGVRSLPARRGVRSLPARRGIRSLPARRAIRSFPARRGIRRRPAREYVRSRLAREYVRRRLARK